MHKSEEKLKILRDLMKQHQIDAFIIPSNDPHLGENIPDHWRVISWLTGFTGSAGTVIVTEAEASLWTDSRYYIQAANQLEGSEFVIMKPDQSGKSYLDWLSDNVKPGDKIGVDGRVFPVTSLKKIKMLTEGKDIIVDTECYLISELWTDRPAASGLQARDHSVTFCGVDRSAKIKDLRDKMKELKVHYQLLTSVDDIMWLLNIRGNDVRYSPLVMAFAIVGEKQILLFIDENKIPQKIAYEFDALDIVMLPYEETEGMLSTLPPGSNILINPTTTSTSLYKSIPEGMKIIEDVSIPTRLKTVKNRVEIENIGKAMIRDGVVLTKFFFWIEKNIGSVPMSELSLTEKLTHLRSQQENYLGLSFAPIIAYNKHGALPHYSALSDTDVVIGPEGILLVDSGSQYLDGTTDITRTISLGMATAGQKKDFTLVLKGMIGLARIKFPAGTTGNQLDLIARKALWDNGLNYGHGTGHGVGFCLNVHEGPVSISHSSNSETKTIIEPGMLISDEPAIYRENEYGIRTENLVICYEDEETEFGKFLKFDTVSLCYIDKSLIDKSLLDQKEIEWLNSYHSQVYEKLTPHLTEEEKAWLTIKTESL